MSPDAKKPFPFTPIVELAQGVYRLVRDVENPHFDRRKITSDFKHKPVWEEGRKFAVLPDYFVEDRTDALILQPIGQQSYFRLWEPRRLTGADVEHDMARVRAIAFSLAPIPESEWTFTDAWWAMGNRSGGGEWLLARLWKAGRITLDDLRLGGTGPTKEGNES